MRNDYFAQGTAMAAFGQTFANHVASELKQLVSQFVSPENNQRLRHGGDWVHPGLPDAFNGGIQQHSSELVVKFDEIVAHDLSLIDRHVAKITNDMVGQFMRMMYATIGAACDKSGNVIDGRGTKPLEAFAAMLEKIQFSADKHGNVTPPQVHLSPEAFERMREAQATASPELLQRIEKAKARKTEEALEEEARRKARFVRYGTES